RCAYVIVPGSILFIKYYPEWGRGFDQWTGAPLNQGIATDKNALGHDCLILGYFFFWHLLQTWRTERSKARRNELLLTLFFLSLIWWLLSMAQSSTSFVSLLAGMLTVALLGLRVVDKRLIGTYVLSALIILVVAEQVFGLSTHVIQFLRKDPTLTD